MADKRLRPAVRRFLVRGGLPLVLLIATACVSPSASPSPTPPIAAPSATPAAETATPSPQTPEPVATGTATPAPTATRTPLALPPVSAFCPAARNVSVLALAKPIGADGVVGLFDASAHNPKVL